MGVEGIRGLDILDRGIKSCGPLPTNNFPLFLITISNLLSSHRPYTSCFLISFFAPNFHISIYIVVMLRHLGLLACCSLSSVQSSDHQLTSLCITLLLISALEHRNILLFCKKKSESVFEEKSKTTIVQLDNLLFTLTRIVCIVLHPTAHCSSHLLDIFLLYIHTFIYFIVFIDN